MHHHLNPATFVPTFMLVFGLGFLVIGVVMLVRRPRRSDWRPARGQVVGVDHRGASDAAFPVVEYRLPDGSVHRFTANTSRSLGDRGPEVSLLVDPTDPRNVELASATGTRTFIAIVFALLGGFVALFSRLFVGLG